MVDNTREELSLEELEAQHAALLPDRELMVAVSVLGIPLVEIKGLEVKIS